MPDWTPSPLELERRVYRSRRTRRSGTIATVSTAVLGGLALTVLVTSPGWPRVQETFFSPSKAWSSLPAVATGLWLNVRVMLVCGVLIGVFGLTLALLRTLRGPVFFPLRLFAMVYTDVFRGLPVLLVLLLLGIGVPALRLQGVPKDPLFWGGLSLVLSYSAYVAEVFRAGIESVHPSQRASARALGLGHAQTMRYVVVPQAVRRVMPALMNDLVSLQKDSSLLAVLAIVDALYAARIETASDFNYTPYVVAGILFLCLTIPMVRFTDWVARRQGFHGAGGIV